MNQLDFSRKLNISTYEKISIGYSPLATIRLMGQGTYNDMQLVLCNESWQGQINHTTNILVNGQVVDNHFLLSNQSFLTLDQYCFYFKFPYIYLSRQVNIETNLPSEYDELNYQLYQQLYFQPTTRYLPNHTPISFCIDAPPKTMVKQSPSRWLTLLPMLSMMIVMSNFMGGNIRQGVPFLMMSVSIGVTVLQIILEKLVYWRIKRKSEKDYANYLSERETQILALRQQELVNLNTVYRSVNMTAKQLITEPEILFDRNRQDDDFLHIYLGVGQIQSKYIIQVEKGDNSDKLYRSALNLKYKYDNIEHAPITLDLQKEHRIGVVGNDSENRFFLSQLTLDIALRHTASDVQLIYICQKDNLKNLLWLKWLPHTDCHTYQQSIVTTQKDTVQLLDKLYSNLTNKSEELTTYTLIFVLYDKWFKEHPIADKLEQLVDLNIRILFFVTTRQLLPKQCSSSFILKGKTVEWLSQSFPDKRLFQYDELEHTMCEQLAKYCGARGSYNQKNFKQQVSLYDCVLLSDQHTVSLQENWKRPIWQKGLAVAVGKRQNGTLFSLDIGDSSDAHGPHGLIAGTTGSGKSEFLQSYILALSYLCQPDECSFILIDFKGGGMANQFVNLPHIQGVFTNSSDYAIKRFLAILQAEILYRQKQFEKYAVNHINQYQQIQQHNDTEKIPHLIIIVDEFAELKSSYPESMQDLISIARIGRTLGVHLILATQKPSGIVDSQIWANTRFKICFKVQSKEDSHDMLHSPLATSLQQAGQGYFQVGNQEIFECIQFAYSQADSVNNGKDKTVYVRNFGQWEYEKYSSQLKNSMTQAQELLQTISLYAHQENLLPKRSICPALLPEQLLISKISSGAIGVLDNIRRQKQEDFVIDVFKDNVWIIGGRQSGKTMALLSILYSLLQCYTPKHVIVYGVDCNSRALHIFEHSKMCGGIVDDFQVENLGYLFVYLEMELARRQKLFSEQQVANFAEFQKQCPNIPLIILMIDDVLTFKQCFPEYMDIVEKISRYALQAGFSVIVTSNTMQALSYRMQLYFNRKLVMTLSETLEIQSVVGKANLYQSRIGRFLIEIDNHSIEGQLASVYENEQNLLCKEIERTNQSYMSCATPIPTMPKYVDRQLYEQQFQKGDIPLGIDYANATWVYFTKQYSILNLLGHVSAKQEFYRFLLSLLQNNSKNKVIEITHIQQLEHWVKQSRDTQLQYILCIADKTIIDELERNDTLFKQLQYDLETNGTFLILNCLNNGKISFAASTLLQYLREESCALYWGNLQRLKFYDTHNKYMPKMSRQEQGVFFIELEQIKQLKVFTIEKER